LRPLLLACLCACATTRSLPKGVERDCFVSPCEATGDLDGDRRPDRLVLVRSGGKHGWAVFWGNGKKPAIIAAGTARPVVQFGDTEATTPRSEGTVVMFPEDMSPLLSWDLIPAARLVREYPFLPAVASDALRMSEGDSAWVLYHSTNRAWYFVPLGY